jgi:hypothetical protein
VTRDPAAGGRRRHRQERSKAQHADVRATRQCGTGHEFGIGYVYLSATSRRRRGGVEAWRVDENLDEAQKARGRLANQYSGPSVTLTSAGISTSASLTGQEPTRTRSTVRSCGTSSPNISNSIDQSVHAGPGAHAPPCRSMHTVIFLRCLCSQDWCTSPSRRHDCLA